MSETREPLHEHGCYGCGHWPVKFGGVVDPAIDSIGKPRTARWWTDCPTCGYIEVTETGVRPGSLRTGNETP